MSARAAFTFGSVCSGIEAASCAWHALGWRAAFFSEIEGFPSAVLRVRWPGVPNLGDMTKFAKWPDGCRCDPARRGKLKPSALRIGTNLNLPIYVCSTCGGIAIDLLVGGTPCQSFSVAGLREGLDDARGRLMLTFVELLARYRPRWFVWENVPGVFSSAGGADFAAFLGAVTGREICVPREGWGNTGIVEGIEDAYGACWRTLDAQYFGVAQRRRRVFVVGHLGGQWQRAAAVLLERSGLRGDPAPSREAGKGVAGTVGASTPSRRNGRSYPTEGSMIAATLTASDGGVCEKDGIDGRIVAAPLTGNAYADREGEEHNLLPEVVGCLSDGAHHGGGLNGQDAYTGQILPVTVGALTTRTDDFGATATDSGHYLPVPFDTTQITSKTNRSHPLAAEGHAPAVAFSCKDHGAHASAEVAPTLRAMGFVGSHANAGGQLAVAFKPSHFTRDKDGAPETTTPPLTADADKGDQDPVLLSGMAVRRLTPRECERLQGFADDYTLIRLEESARKKVEDDFLAYLQRALRGCRARRRRSWRRTGRGIGRWGIRWRCR